MSAYPALAAPEQPQERRGATYLARAAVGIGWRVTAVLGALAAVAAGLRPSWQAIAVTLGAGLVLGLWHRPWKLARAWRWVVLSVGVAVLGLSTLYLPELLLASLCGAWACRSRS